MPKYHYTGEDAIKYKVTYTSRKPHQSPKHRSTVFSTLPTTDDKRFRLYLISKFNKKGYRVLKIEKQEAQL